MNFLSQMTAALSNFFKNIVDNVPSLTSIKDIEKGEMQEPSPTNSSSHSASSSPSSSEHDPSIWSIDLFNQKESQIYSASAKPLDLEASTKNDDNDSEIDFHPQKIHSPVIKRKGF
jgi:hypothetical protein